MLKILDKLISKSFIGPSLLSFFVALFVLVMQFLWKYIDEILGKGFTIFDLLELIFYFSVTLIPMALPITILISSVMVYGDMAEKYELSSFKSAGVSMLRLLLPGFMIAVLIAGFSFLSSNLLKPNANFQFQKRLTQLRNQKTALAFEEGIFNNSFDDVLIKINDIDTDGKTIKDIIIFDHTAPDKSSVNIVKAKEGLMYTGGDGKYFVMELDSGTQYIELDNQPGSQQGQKRKYPFLRTEFKKYTKVFDMSQFDLDDGFTQFNRKREELLNSFQLKRSIDSFDIEMAKFKKVIFSEIQKKLEIERTATSIEEKTKLTVEQKNSFLAKDSLDRNSPETIPSPPVQTKKLVSKKYLLHNQNEEYRDSLAGTKSSFDVQKIKIGTKHFIPMDKFEGKYDFWHYIPESARNDVLTRAIASLNSNRESWVSNGHTLNEFKKSREKYLFHLHQHFSWAVICILFLLIGAPMGSIIKKGGYGYPFLVAVLFYMVFIITTIFGTKLVRSDSMGGILAAWLPCIIQAPFGFLLTFMALRDIQVKEIFSNIWQVMTLKIMKKGT